MITNLILWSRKMNLSKKFLLSSLVLGFVLSSIVDATAARRRLAEEETSEEGSILFRIENIKPIENKEGLVDKCSFVVTAFNRMEKTVKEATLDLGWVDMISGKYYITGEKVEVVEDPEDAETVVNAQVTLTNLLPHKQKSFEAVVETEKCFLLFDSLKYDVKNCLLEGDKLVMKDSRVVGNVNSCGKNFNYINSKNPEYYSEFKDVPDSVIERQKEEEKANEIAKINNDYQGVNKELENAGRILNEIK